MVQYSQNRKGKDGEQVKKFLEEAKKRGGTSFFLEVRESNLRARNLYRSFGFEEIDVRKKFYEAPVEDGIVMCKR